MKAIRWILSIVMTFGIVNNRASAQNELHPELPFKAINFSVLDWKTKKPISDGTETINYSDGVISKKTIYWRPGDKNNIIQEESCSFDIKTLRPKAYKFTNKFTGESVLLSGRGYWADSINYRESQSRPEVVTPFPWEPKLIIGKTLHHLIVRAWSVLQDGQSKSFPLFVPMARDQYGFRVVKRKNASLNGATATVLSLELDNWALRQLAPEMLFYYVERSNLPLLERYEGPTTVVTDENKDKKVTIEFSYEK